MRSRYTIKEPGGVYSNTGMVVKWVALGLALIFAAAGQALPAAEDWRQEGLPGVFRCEIPRDWRVGDLIDKSGDIGRSFKGGLLHIRVEHLAGPGPGPRTPRDYLTLFELGGRKFIPGESLEVNGRPAQRWSRRYSVRGRTPRGSGPETQVYEEVVFLEGHDGVWALRFNSKSALHRQDPQGLEIWHRFLRSFQLR